MLKWIPLLCLPSSIVLWHSWAQAQLAFRGRSLGAHQSYVSLKTRGAKCVDQSFCFSGRSWELRIPSKLYGAMLGVAFRVKVCLNIFISMWIFPPCVGVTWLVSRFLSEKIVACVIVYLVCFVLFFDWQSSKAPVIGVQSKWDTQNKECRSSLSLLLNDSLPVYKILP